MSFVLREYQRDALERLRIVFAGKVVRRCLLVAPTGSGKCLAPETPVLKFDGSIVAAQDVREGDLLMGPDSTPRAVLGACRGRGPLYRVTPIKGDPWVCNDIHVLTLVNTTTGNIVDIDVQAYLAKNRTFKHEHKLFMPECGVTFPVGEPLPLDPYFAGVWFGDGSKRHDRVAVSKPDPEIVAACHEMAESFGLKVRSETSSGSCPTHYIHGERGAGNPLMRRMRTAIPNVHEVPQWFRVASREDRLAFMAGIIDTDGHVAYGGVDLVQRHKGIFDGIVFVARSLGFRVTTCEKIVNETLYYRMSISGDLSCVPTRIARKKIQPRLQKKCATRTGFSLEPIGDGEYAGFELDGDGRFLLGDFTVTHNTVCASAVGLGAMLKNARVLMVAHRTELIRQAFCKLVRAGIPLRDCGVIMGDTKLAHGSLVADEALPASDAELWRLHGRRRPRARAQVGSIQTLRNRLKHEKPATSAAHAKELEHPDIVIVDEAHLSLASSYLQLFALYPYAYFIGLTATPYRADKRSLGILYDDMVLVSSPSELIALGAIIAPRAFTVPACDLPNLSGVKIKGGDYDHEQLTAAVDQKGLVGNIVEHWLARAEGRQTIVFAASVEHSKHIVSRFVEAGIKAEHLDGETDPDERIAILGRLESGETKVVGNFGVLTEGFDCPPVKCCVLARPTKSLGLYIQMGGRILRPYTDPRTGLSIGALILDHAGCIIEHNGLPTKDRDLSGVLEDTPKRAKKKAVISVRVCDGCLAILEAGTRVCDVCGKELPMGGPKGGEMEEADGQLVEVVNTTREDEANAYREMLAEAERKGHKSGWAYFRFKEKFQKDPPRGVKPKTTVQLDAPEEVMRAEWERLKAERTERGYKPAWVTVRFEAKFGKRIPATWMLDDMRAVIASQGEMSRAQIGEMVF